MRRNQKKEHIVYKHNNARKNVFIPDICVKIPSLRIKDKYNYTHTVQSQNVYYNTYTTDYMVPALFILSYTDVYFGEYKETDKITDGEMDLIPNGIGLIGKLKYPEFDVTMCENVTHSDISNDGYLKNGSYFKVTKDYTLFSSYKDNLDIGINLYVYDDYHLFSNQMYNKSRDLLDIRIKTDSKGNYYINKYKNGEITNKQISFESGRFYFRNLAVKDNNIVHIINDKWDYKYYFKKLFFQRDFISYEKPYIKPARYEELERKLYDNKTNGAMSDYAGIIKNKYYGGIQTTIDPSYDDRKRSFTASGYGYGIYPYENGDLYFGYFSNDTLSGPGLYKYNKGGSFLGFFFDNELSGPGLSYSKDSLTFNSYLCSKRIGAQFSIEKDGIKIFCCDNKTDEIIGHSFFIEYETFNLYEYDEYGELVDKFIFDNFDMPIEDVSNKQKVDPKDLENLNNKGFECEVDENGKIFIVKCNLSNNKEIVIPNNIYGIRENAFATCHELNRIEIPTNIEIIEENAFINCPASSISFYVGNNNLVLKRGFSNSKNVSNIIFGNNINKIEKRAFSECLQLKYVIVKNDSCVIEKGAFPKKCKIIQDKKKDDSKEKSNDKPENVKKYKEKNKTIRKEKNTKKIFGGLFASIGAFFLTIFGILAAPFTFIGKMFAKIFGGLVNKTSEDGVASSKLIINSILFVIQLLIVGFVVYDGLKNGNGEQWLVWPVNNVPSLMFDLLGNYNFFLFNFLLNCASSANVIISILLIIPVILSLIIDLLVYVFGFIIGIIVLLILLILTIVISLTPIVFLIYYLIGLIKAEEGKMEYVIFLLLTIILGFIYFFIMFKYAGWTLF